MTSFYRRRSILAFAGLAAAVPVLAACSSGKKTGSSAASSAKVAPTSSVPTGMPDGKGSGQADGVFPRTVVHFKGSTEIPAAPSKVVILSTGQLDVALTLGIVPIGSTKGDGAETVPEYLKKAFPDHADQLGSITDVGSRKSPSVEDNGNLSPDLLLVNQAGKDDIDALYSSLSAVAPTVVTPVSCGADGGHPGQERGMEAGLPARGRRPGQAGHRQKVDRDLRGRCREVQ